MCHASQQLVQLQLHLCELLAAPRLQSFVVGNPYA